MKWHGIPASAHALTEEEKDYVLSLLRKWMEEYI
jgi:hypothetical protein